MPSCVLTTSQRLHPIPSSFTEGPTGQLGSGSHLLCAIAGWNSDDPSPEPPRDFDAFSLWDR